MGDGEQDAFEPAGQGPLPREDRLWRHPSEMAIEARQAAGRTRRRRIRTGSTLLGGLAAVSGLIWLSTNGGTDVTLNADVTAIDGIDELAPSSSMAAAATLDAAVDSYLAVRSTEDAEMLAGALMGPDGFVITTGSALGNASEVLITWGDQQASGHVVGHDAVTDVTVIELATTFLSDNDFPTDTNALAEGDVVTFADPTGKNRHQRVVNTQSASANYDGSPMVGIVELDGRIGDIPPGSPAYDDDGRIIGMTTATAETAPAALVPIELVRGVSSDLITDGTARHPWLGVTARNSEDEGSLVTAVTVDGPADTGGVLVGDLIVEIGDTPISTMESMVATLRQFEPGDATTVTVMRDGERVGCSVELALHVDAT